MPVFLYEFYERMTVGWYKIRDQLHHKLSFYSPVFSHWTELNGLTTVQSRFVGQTCVQLSLE